MPGTVQDAAVEHQPNEGGSWKESGGAPVGQQSKDSFGGQWGSGKALKAKAGRLCQKTVFVRDW